MRMCACMGERGQSLRLPSEPPTGGSLELKIISFSFYIFTLLYSCSGFVSVASVNVIIALYVVMAFREDKDEEKRQPVPAVGVWAMQRTKERTD